MIRSIMVVGALALGIGSVLAQSDPIATRKATMKKLSAANAEVTKINKGEAPFNLSTVQAALAEMQNAAKVMPAQYPENAKTGGETRALPKIWETKSDFDARFVKLNKDAADAAGKIKDEATFKTTYAEVTKNCDSCHDSYRKAR